MRGPDGTGAVGIADLLTAAIAAEHRLTLINHDADFDIAGGGFR